MNPLRDCHLRTHLILRVHTRIFARAYYPRPNNVSHVAVGRSMCHAGTKSATPSIAPSSEPQWRLTLIEPLSPFYLGKKKRSRSDGRKLLFPSTSRTLSARCGESATDLLAGLDAPLAWQTPLSANSIASQLAKNRARRTGGHESTRLFSKERYPTYGSIQHL